LKEHGKQEGENLGEGMVRREEKKGGGRVLNSLENKVGPNREESTGLRSIEA